MKSLNVLLWVSYFLVNGSTLAVAHDKFPSPKPAKPTASVDQLYENSLSSPILSIINGAKTSIDIEIYTMKDQGVIAALKAAMARGVKLRIIQTDYTMDSCQVFQKASQSDSASCAPLKAFVTYVRAQHGQYVPFSNELCGTPGQNCFQHGKILISDANKIMISTGNFDPTSLCDLSEKPSTCNRDFSLVSEDPNVISTIQEIFDNDLLGKTFNLQSILSSSAAQRLTVSPDATTPIVNLIQSAKRSILLENQYLDDPTMNQALVNAAKRGVKVSVMVASVSSFGKPNPSTDGYEISQWTNTFTEFDQAGIHSTIFNGSMLVDNTPGYLHAKVMVVDGNQAWIGSVNGSTESLTENREFGILSLDSQVVSTLSAAISADFANPHAETWQQSLACTKDPQSDCNASDNSNTRERKFF